MAPHPPFKQSAITPLPLPSPLNHFSSQKNMFDPSKEQPKSFFSLSDHLRFSNSYGRAMNNDSKATKTAQNHANYSSWNDESGVSSPPLWKTSPQHEKTTDYRCLSPSSRAQAIARGQRELMEMVSKMPESCYELTLKDLVEHQQQQAVVDEPKEESFAGGRSSSYKSERQNSQKQQFNRSGSLDNGGFLLKMVFPVSLGSKKKKNINNNNKKKNDCNTNNNSKVSPKPTVADASSKTSEKDWWKKRSESSESDGGGSTINRGGTKSSRSSSSSGSGRSNGCRSISSTTSHRYRRKGCLAFIFCRRNKASR
ncbi:rho GTPase-activating protein gacU-like isoform X2 [Hibiscus syriacus]|uniref:rho GTPase-activating protein gacU-like isoform X2 n=1 Tax=Hibiscus syriacus TaxID=106335 RepID=UPI0019228ADE|nr:rho GTPase-activating protein gacU-like isoform X2 [Hibiscus syriacus]